MVTSRVTSWNSPDKNVPSIVKNAGWLYTSTNIYSQTIPEHWMLNLQAWPPAIPKQMQIKTQRFQTRDLQHGGSDPKQQRLANSKVQIKCFNVCTYINVWSQLNGTYAQTQIRKSEHRKGNTNWTNDIPEGPKTLHHIKTCVNIFAQKMPPVSTLLLVTAWNPFTAQRNFGARGCFFFPKKGATFLSSMLASMRMHKNSAVKHVRSRLASFFPM